MTAPKFRCRATIPVQWGDVDRMQHVNNVVFFKWMETTRTRYFEEVELARHVGPSCYPILVSIGADYRRQLRDGGSIFAECSVSRVGTTSCTHVYRIVEAKSGAVVCDGEGTWVLFDYHAQAPIELPATLISAIEAYEDTVFPRPPAG